MKPGIVITIDGPAGTGKSSAAAALALRLGFDMLDTGAMYRAVALLAIERAIAPSNGPGIVAEMDRCELVVDFSSRPPIVRLGSRDVHERIRDEDVTRIVSEVASHTAVRARMVEAQRAVAAQHARLITEGRDQGSVVFPDAAVRLWLDARPEVRAHRRAEELRCHGLCVNDHEVMADISARDASDRGRRDGPLARPSGAVSIDTSDLSFAQVLEELERVVRARVPASAVGCGCGGLV
ncbi:MAG: (d)CMP kinase [Phycisphaerales bacterium]|nr:(d)CMP kinase [Phycisphaerales bacterium]